jgi:two-component system, OmpR family, response regulator ChvI
VEKLVRGLIIGRCNVSTRWLQFFRKDNNAFKGYRGFAIGSSLVTTIFLVDDEPDIANSLKTGLERKGFDVDVFTDPTEALAKYKPHYYDLLLIDIRMPKLNGFELVREIRKVDTESEVWFLTAFEVYYEEFKKMFPNLDVKSFIRKPVSLNELSNRIANKVALTQEKEQ